MAWLAAVVIAALGLWNGPAFAAPAPGPSSSNGPATATINVGAQPPPPVRSVTVSPATTVFDTCGSGTGTATGATLVFPNGVCDTTGADNVTITNGSTAGHIDVQGANAVPSDNGTAWTLCGATGGAACTGNGMPGQNQFSEEDAATSTLTSATPQAGPVLSSQPQCDTGFSGNCTAAANQATNETLQLEGPSASTDASSSFTTVWTWTAVP